jgi:hypothetical protein
MAMTAMILFRPRRSDDRIRSVVGRRLKSKFGDRERWCKMETAKPPRKYPEWRMGQYDRAEDAAYVFGYYLMLHCKEEVVATLPTDAPPATKAAVEKAVDAALHNLCDMLEGFWRLEAGADHTVSLALAVQVRDAQNEVVETQEISPCKLDLPIGYWKWANDREFQ